MGKKTLSKRLLMSISLVPAGSRTADIGCDHGFVSIYLYENRIAEKVIAMDVHEGPLEKAKRHIADAGLTAEIECRRSDGLENLSPEEADTLFIAGMGGILTISILSESLSQVKKMKHLILQPQSQIHKVRHFLHENGFAITEERMVFEEGKYYTALHAVPGEQKFDHHAEYLYGKDLIEKKDKVLLEFLKTEYERYRKISEGFDLRHNGKSAARRQEIKECMNRLHELIQTVAT